MPRTRYVRLEAGYRMINGKLYKAYALYKITPYGVYFDSIIWEPWKSAEV